MNEEKLQKNNNEDVATLEAPEKSTDSIIENEENPQDFAEKILNQIQKDIESFPDNEEELKKIEGSIILGDPSTKNEIKKEIDLDNKLNTLDSESRNISEGAKIKITETVQTSEFTKEKGSEFIETKNFTKEYSSFWRDELSKKIHDIRSKYNEKKVLVEKENLERTDKKTEIQSEISVIEKEINKIQANIETHKLSLEKEKGRMTYRIASFIGYRKELPEEAQISNLEDKSKNLQEDVGQKKILLSESSEIILDQNESEEAEKEILKFYEEQKGIQDVLEKEKNKERDIASISKEKKVLFLHTLPVDGYGMNNTSENNKNLDTKTMTSIDKARMILGIEPTISVSSVSISGENIHSKLQTMYPIGLIIGEGTAVSAYDSDEGTYADSLFSRRSKYDRTAKSTIQENFTENIENALAGQAKERTNTDKPWNEIIVENPKVSGVFLDMTRLLKDQDRGKAKDAMKQAFNMGKELGIPVYNIQPNGEMINLLDESFKTVTQEKVLSYQCDLGSEEKIGEMEKILKTQEKPNQEIQKRLTEIKATKKLNENVLKLQEKKSSYSFKAEECLNAFKYENIANAVLNDINFFGNDVEYQKIIDTAVNVAERENLNQNGLNKITLLFKNKPTEEIKILAESLLKDSKRFTDMINTRDSIE